MHFLLTRYSILHGCFGFASAAEKDQVNISAMKRAGEQSPTCCGRRKGSQPQCNGGNDGEGFLENALGGVGGHRLFHGGALDGRETDSISRAVYHP